MTEHNCCSLVSIFDATGTKSLVHNLSASPFVCPSTSSSSSSSSMQLKKAVAGSKEKETVIECLSMVSIIIMTYLNILLTSDTL